MEIWSGIGIFGDEIEPIFALIRAHRPLEEVEATPCPCCGAPIVVAFQPDGSGFTVLYRGEPPHLSTYQEFADPPAWWPQRADKPLSVTFYWPECRSFRDGGTIHLGASGWDGSTHGTGSIEIAPDHADHGLWRWILGQEGRFRALLTDDDLPALREEYRRST